MGKISCTVKIEFYELPTKKDIREYIKDAIGSWGGGGHPDDYFSPDNIKNVTISKINALNRKQEG